MARHFDLTAFTYAHRGLWSPEGHPENSLAAFKAAVKPLVDESINNLRLAGTNEPIPTLAALLDIWPTSLPLLTEMKIDGNTDPEAFARKVGDQLAGHIGPAAAMSFSEPAVDALPDVLMRGQLIHPIHRTSETEFDAKLARAIDRKVDYLAINVADAERAAVLLAGERPFVVWTIRSMADLRRIRLLHGAAIVEHLPVPLAS